MSEENQQIWSRYFCENVSRNTHPNTILPHIHCHVSIPTTCPWKMLQAVMTHLSSSTCSWGGGVGTPTLWVIAWGSNSKPGARQGRLLMETMRCLRITPTWWAVSVWVAGGHVAAAVVAGGRVIPQDTTMRRSFWPTIHTTASTTWQGQKYESSIRQTECTTWNISH